MRGWRLSAGLAGLALVVPLWAAPLGAADWTIVPEGSGIEFTYTLNETPGRGTFRSFSGTGRFDEEMPEAATLDLTIETASVDLGNAIVNALATSAEGFDSANHPEAVYRLTTLEPEGDGRFLARGEVRIKGVTAALAVPIMLEIGTDAARAEGRIELDRRRFGLGVGPFASLVDLAPMVGVHFVLTARPDADAAN
jgi:polyisoprenoid-binding protein YceI